MSLVVTKTGNHAKIYVIIIPTNAMSRSEKMKKYGFLIVVMTSLMLVGCASKEAKRFTETDDFKQEVEQIILDKGEVEFGLELDPNMEKAKFALNSGIPTVNENRVLIPVKTKNQPIFTFNADAEIQRNDDGTMELIDVDIEGDGANGLGMLGEFLLTNLFLQAYEQELDRLGNFDKHVKVKVDSVKVQAKRSLFIESKEEERRLAFSLSEDYKLGEFEDGKNIEEMLDKHMRDGEISSKVPLYLPEINLELLKPAEENIVMEEKFDAFIAHLKGSKDIPAAIYSVHYSPESKEEERLHELIIVK